MIDLDKKILIDKIINHMDDDYQYTLTNKDFNDIIKAIESSDIEMLFDLIRNETPICQEGWKPECWIAYDNESGKFLDELGQSDETWPQSIFANWRKYKKWEPPKIEDGIYKVKCYKPNEEKPIFDIAQFKKGEVDYMLNYDKCAFINIKIMEKVTFDG